MSKPEEQSQARASMKLLRSGWSQFGVMAAAVALVVGVGAVLLYPPLYLRGWFRLLRMTPAGRSQLSGKSSGGFLRRFDT